MKYTTCLFFTFIFTFCHIKIYGQTGIDADNISRLAFWHPDLKLKNENIRRVIKRTTVVKNNGQMIEESFYDSNGYLIGQKNLDKISLKDSEVVTIKNSGYHSFIVERKVNKNSLLLAGENPYLFWSGFLQLKRNKAIEKSSIVKSTAKYTWTKDSTLQYESYLNGEKIQSGVAVVISKDTSKNYFYSKDSVRKQDTLIVRTREGVMESYDQIEDFYFKDRILRETSTWFNNEERSVIPSFIVYYYYDSLGKKKKEEYYSRTNLLFKTRDYNEDKTVLERKYDDNGKFQSSEKFDFDGKTLEYFQVRWIGKEIKEKFVYKYFLNGLLSSEELWVDGELFSKADYQYFK
jgi:hypothetical protein